MPKNGLKKLMIFMVNINVVIIALYAFWDLDVNELWIEFGKGKIRDYYHYTYMQIYQETQSVKLCFSGAHLQDAIRYHNSKVVVRRELGNPGDSS